MKINKTCFVLMFLFFGNSVNTLFAQNKNKPQYHFNPLQTIWAIRILVVLDQKLTCRILTSLRPQVLNSLNSITQHVVVPQGLLS